MTGHKYKDEMMAMAVEAQTSATPWDIFEYKNRTTHVWLMCSVEPLWENEYTVYRLKPKIKVIDWSKVNYDVVPVKSENTVFYTKDVEVHPKATLVTGKKIAWTGGECPLPEGVLVRVCNKGGDIITMEAARFDWGYAHMPDDIIWFEITGLADGYSWGEV